jgi:hypothetical protein
MANINYSAFIIYFCFVLVFLLSKTVQLLQNIFDILVIKKIKVNLKVDET